MRKTKSQIQKATEFVQANPDATLSEVQAGIGIKIASSTLTMARKKAGVPLGARGGKRGRPRKETSLQPSTSTTVLDGMPSEDRKPPRTWHISVEDGNGHVSPGEVLDRLLALTQDVGVERVRQMLELAEKLS